MIGMKFGRWLAMGLAGRNRWGQALIKCLCDCGNTMVVRADSLKSGATTSCGCWRKEATAERHEKMLGQRYNRAVVMELAGLNQHGDALVKCLCDCGNTFVTQVNNLKSGNTTSCGCWNREVVAEVTAERHAASRDKMLGERYGKGVATELAGFNQHGQALVKCLCDCGNTFVARAKDLKSGNTTSCGCWQKEAAAKATTTHGMSSTAEYDARENMLHRCYYPKAKGYENYGGRGIKVCDRWQNSFEAFYEDVGPKPGKGYHLHRKSRNDDYGPDTTAWATHKQCKADRAAEKKNT